jgi:hypothetical protein
MALAGVFSDAAELAVAGPDVVGYGHVLVPRFGA